MTSISFEKYSAYSHVLRGQMTTSDQEEIERQFEATFNDRLKGGPGWIIRNKYSEQVTAWIESSESFVLCETAKSEINVGTILASIASIEGQLHNLKALVSQLDLSAGNTRHTPSKSQIKAIPKSQVEPKASSAPRLLGGR